MCICFLFNKYKTKSNEKFNTNQIFIYYIIINFIKSL